MSDLVSVILPVYNRLGTLEEACRSVLDQSYRNLELIVVDDASTEDLTPVIEKIGDPRLRFVRQPVNGGAGAARNAGLAVAKGELIAFQDSDDLWLPGKLEHQVSVMAEQPADVGAVLGGKIAYGADGAGAFGPGMVTYAPAAFRQYRLDQDQLALALNRNRLSVQNALFRRNCYPDLQWFNALARANEDWDFAVRLLQHCQIYEEIEPVVLAYSTTSGVSSNLRRQALGHLIMLRTNRHLADRYPLQFARSKYTLGRLLANLGKKRSGRAFMRDGIRKNPRILTYLVYRAGARLVGANTMQRLGFRLTLDSIW